MNKESTGKFDFQREIARHLDTNGDGRISESEQVVHIGESLHKIRSILKGRKIPADEIDSAIPLSAEKLQAEVKKLVGKHAPGGVERISDEQMAVLRPILEDFAKDFTVRQAGVAEAPGPTPAASSDTAPRKGR